MNTIGDAEFYTADIDQVRRCKQALIGRQACTETYDTPTGEKTVTGMVTSVHEEAGPKWRITIKPSD